MKQRRPRGAALQDRKRRDTGNVVILDLQHARKPDTPEHATAFIREIAFHHHVGHLHRLGPRAIAEFFSEVGERHLCRTSIENRLADYTLIDPSTLAGLEWWRR